MHTSPLTLGDLISPNDIEALTNLPVGSAIATTDHTHMIWQKVGQNLDHRHRVRDTWRNTRNQEGNSYDLNNADYPYQIIYLPDTNEQEKDQ